ncbi:NAD-dependent protein deacetylase, SIR2 family [Psychrilyobacter piezotolerans]|uniref:NAD-dependent protein deacetylase, SIR2 family n=2 Tax=Fusobacteriaceae TaxID=203492 RepID=A0ABX9KJE2_9FUSO|nr:NAD-dependent protein deacetylase, SIR2 family [Psychrilyobacter piezotolerans]MCS5421138.1 hypothetical protein [Psychrilyobacter sp. S5]NDI77090.1 NAD-dependent protein deacetylase, SIR2 family [Psychrilyobacter piezotolerans]RDE64091.1 NAD-dependent protein deacetylase, SIR2 family [Psychrilyobacter sp. S5]REI42183.1 NAD-dependent protein deacetylase, SIR2 family [Psychrilyobacter piezotolerans]
MFSKIKTMKYTKNSSDDIKKIKNWIKEADAIVIGGGAGLSASGGLNYYDVELVKKWFPEYYKMGFNSLPALQGRYWVLKDSNPQKYWGYWARHIYHIRYETELLKSHSLLYELVKDKDHFIITSNADGQFEKTEFSKERIFAPQGDYAFFQCSEPCSDEIYYNAHMVRTMIDNMISPYEIDKKDIPLCPRCNKPLVPNLRCDNTFVETPHMKNLGDYKGFINKNKGKKLLFLELGIGYNTPGLIRYPFEIMTQEFENASLVRINKSDSRLNENLKNKAISLGEDIIKVLEKLLNK